jgi:AcrR family transcriptional regulator
MARRATTREAVGRDGWDRRREILLHEYERVALELFAARGYHNVSVEDIAIAAGVTTRTLFRYFGSKVECLLGLPRRGLAAELEMIEALETSGDPLTTAWEGLREFVTTSPVDPRVVGFWEAAAEGAPDVVARVRGERIEAIFRAFTAYGERCYGVDQDRDPRPRWFAGILSGLEFALVDTVPQAPEVLGELLVASALTIRVCGQLHPISGAPRLSRAD